MIKGGYILQPRSYDKSNVFNKLTPCGREVWTYILRNVNYVDNGFFKRGTGFFNISQIKEDLHWVIGYTKRTYSKNQLNTALKRLRSADMIQSAKTSRGLIITVCKYDYYQNPKNYEARTEPTNETPTNQPTEQSTINKKEKKEKKVKEVYIPTFDEFKIFALKKDEDIDLKALENKYESWVVNDWKDGNNKEIKNWKSKLLNTLTYIPKNGKSRNGFQKDRAGASESQKADIPTGACATEWSKQ